VVPDTRTLPDKSRT